MQDDGQNQPDGFGARLRALELRVHRPLLGALGLEISDLEGIVTRMFAGRRRDAVSYWLQLLLSMGIATLGLALNSTAVVIGAMLIAPLMGPIVELGMALVVGSAALTVRSLGRTVGGVAAVVAGAALLTMALPFHEVNAEITSRTFPTALDLLIAIFVALAAVLTTVRSSSETAAAAAGAAIGIALVPPLCVMGLGLGIRDLDVAGGATLLFVTNLSAILFISVICFLALGFETVSATKWDEATLAEVRPGGITARAVHSLEWVFGSRYGRIARVAVPGLLVAAVSVPLARALDQVAWEVTARNAVARAVDRALGDLNAVQRTVSVQSGAVAIQLYVVGSVDTAAALERTLTAEIAEATSVAPTVRVIAVPDQSVLRQVRASVESDAAVNPVGFAELRARIDARLKSVWPQDQLGALIGWYLEFPDSTSPTVVVRYQGEPAGPGVEELVGRSISESAGIPVALELLAHGSITAAEPAGRGLEWLPDLVRGADAVRSGSSRMLCVRIPTPNLLDADGRRVAAIVRTELGRLPAGRWELVQEGELWSAVIRSTSCQPNVTTGSASAPATP